ncbi:MAG: S8/S53 family peptidase [Spirochaetales bacterium]|nr:S8/S53 family peptidase [Spirochaetales bacterium]
MPEFLSGNEALLAAEPNVLFAGGTSSCSPSRMLDSSAYGDGVILAAPAKGVPAFHQKGNLMTMTGNCFAVPQIASLAAVLKYIIPELQPKHIKALILAFSWNTAYHDKDPEKKHAVQVPSFARAIAQAIAYQATRYEDAEALRSLGALNMPVPASYADEWRMIMPLVFDTGTVMSSLCDTHLDYHVRDFGAYQIEALIRSAEPSWASLASSTVEAAKGEIGPDSFSIWGAWGMKRTSPAPKMTSLFMESNGTSFSLRKMYQIGESNQPGIVLVHFRQDEDGEERYFGHGKRGSLVFEGCEILSRHNVSHAPAVVAVAGRFEGVLAMYEWIDSGKNESRFVGEKVFAGEFTLPFHADHANREVCSLLEGICRGGFGACRECGKQGSP